MVDGSDPPHKLTDLCQEFMWQPASVTDGTVVPLFDVMIPILSGQQSSGAVVMYCSGNKEAVELI
jgi:hypothetical protein